MTKASPITIIIPKIDPAIWMPIMGNGIGIPIAPLIPLKSFLCEQINISADYLENRIQTILINGRAIDDVNPVYLADQDIIALSAAMPGLAGTTLRRGSHLAGMRRTITHPAQLKTTATTIGKNEGMVTLKLFNLVAREVGEKILDGNILLRQKDLNDLLINHPIVAPTAATILKSLPQAPPTASEKWIAVHIKTAGLD